MLNALLKHRTGREDRQALSSRRSLYGYEDPLTATVLERLSYLPKRVAWEVLRSSAEWSFTGRPLARSCPAGNGIWRFWPQYTLAESRVEPDADWIFPDGTAIVFESKHHDRHTVSQWQAEIAAVEDAGHKVVFVGLGDQLPADLDSIKPGSTRNVFWLSWNRMAKVADRLARRSDVRPHHRRLLHDLVAALELWGYPLRLWFRGLPVDLKYSFDTPLPSLSPPGQTVGFRALVAESIAPDALARWRP